MKNEVIILEENENNNIREDFYCDIQQLIENARKRVKSYANSTLLFVYWNIGKMIIEEQGGEDRAKYGNKIIEALSKKLTKDYGEGFNQRTLRRMRQFYLTFKIWSTVRTELTWTHYRLLLPIKEDHIRNYYIEETIKCCWTARQLERQINTFAYSRSLQNMNLVDNIGDNIDFKKNNTSNIIKDPYVLEFLGLDNNLKYIEKDLEEALINHLQNFLLELGKGFTFVARQKRILLECENYYVDLVFYNIYLRCYVVVELKTEKLSYEALGQIDMYRNYYDQEIKSKDDNPTIGLLLVTETNSSVAKYSSIYKDNKIFVSKYMTYLPTEDELIKVINEEKNIIEEYKLLKNKS